MPIDGWAKLFPVTFLFILIEVTGMLSVVKDLTNHCFDLVLLQSFLYAQESFVTIFGVGYLKPSKMWFCNR